MKIPFQNLIAPYHELKEEFDEAYHRFMESGWYVLGKEVSAFEEEYAAYCEAKLCVGVGHGLDALHLALRALDVGPGDEVIVPTNTYIATWLAVTQAGATVVPVEPDPLTFNIDPLRIEEAVTKQTKVILPVNLYGQPCDYDPILALARAHGLKVVIDNAQSQGAGYKGKRVGGLADIECHSFYPTKNLGAFGEAGAITTNDANLADKVRVLRNYGSRVRYFNEVAGYNSRLDELQAGFLRVKLRHLDEWNSRRTKLAAEYLCQLSALPPSLPLVSPNGLHKVQAPPSDPIAPVVSPQLSLPHVPPWATPVWHLFVIRHPQRDALQKHLAAAGIQTLIHYPVPPHLSGAYRNPSSSILNPPLPIAEALASEVLSLPMGPHVPDSAPQLVAEAIRSF